MRSRPVRSTGPSVVEQRPAHDPRSRSRGMPRLRRRSAAAPGGRRATRPRPCGPPGAPAAGERRADALPAGLRVDGEVEDVPVAQREAAVAEPQLAVAQTAVLQLQHGLLVQGARPSCGGRRRGRCGVPPRRGRPRPTSRSRRADPDESAPCQEAMPRDGRRVSGRWGGSVRGRRCRVGRRGTVLGLLPRRQHEPVAHVAHGADQRLVARCRAWRAAGARGRRRCGCRRSSRSPTPPAAAARG